MVNTRVNGDTDVFGVIGNPIHHTFSPCIQNTCADELGKNMIYAPFHVLNDRLEFAIKGAFGLKIKGLNVTVPHKKTVMEFLHKIDKRAEAIGAVNTLKYSENGYIGYNTDIIGIEYALKGHHQEIDGKEIVIMGAGGSACAATVLMASSGAKKITIANRTVSKAEELKAHVNKFYDTKIDVVSIDEMDKIQKCDILFNTTTVGFGDKVGQSPLKDKSFFKEKNVAVAFDVIYTPWETKFLEEARENDLITINGFDMLIYQAVAAQEIWFDEKFDIEKIKKIRDDLELYYKKLNNVK